jgi:uncharacterized protein (TIGR03437 family)
MLRWLLVGVATVSVVAQPRVDAVVNGASFETVISRGSLVSIFGARLSQSAMSATTLPLPTKLGNTVVKVGDLELAAPLYFVSANQINAQIPYEVLGDSVTLTVTTSEGASAPIVLSLTASAPGLFTASGNGRGRALVLSQDFHPLDTVLAGEPVILYATGLGPTDPPVLSGSPGSEAEPFNRAVTAPDVYVGEFPAQVTFAGLAPGLSGVYQLNVIPQRIASDRAFIRSRGISSNTAEIGMQAGKNVTNVSGSIQAIYPTGDPAEAPASYSPILLAARFTARMDILPTAGPFIIAAVSEGGASLIQVDPGNGRFDASVTVPTISTRNGDFSAAGLTPIDLITCSRMSPGGSTFCFPFPGGILPASRIPPGERMAANLFPLPNTNVASSPTALFRATGAARPGSTFVIDANTNDTLSAFAGYITIPLPPVPTRTTTLKLFVDGMLVASTEVTYRVVTF